MNSLVETARLGKEEKSIIFAILSLYSSLSYLEESMRHKLPFESKSIPRFYHPNPPHILNIRGSRVKVDLFIQSVMGGPISSILVELPHTPQEEYHEDDHHN